MGSPRRPAAQERPRGASLESLAKGAAQFSRKFRIRELQNRWHSLLYDDSVASEVADQILFLESSLSNSSKDDKSSCLRGSECVNRKRNFEFVRRHYYSLTKRTCKEPANFLCQDSFVNSSSRNAGQVEKYYENFIAGITNDTCIFKSSTDTPFEIPRPCQELDLHFKSGNSGPLKDKFPVATIDQEYLNDLTEDILYLGDKTLRGYTLFDYGSDSHTDDISHVLEGNLDDFYDGSHDLIGDHTNQLTVTESFLRVDVLHYKSPASFCSNGIHQFEVSFSLPNLEICKTTEATWEPVNLVDYHFAVEENGLLPDVESKKVTSEHILQPKTNAKDYQLSLSEKGPLEGSCTLLEIFCEEENLDMDIDSVNSVMLKPLVVSDAKGLLTAGSSVVEEGLFRGHLDMVETGFKIASDDDLDFLPLQCIEVPIASHKITDKYDEDLFCSLNAEHSDIPDNSDIFPMVDLLSFPYESAGSSFLCTDTFIERQTSDEKLILLLEGISPLVHEMPGSTSEGCVEVFSPCTSGYEKKSGIVEIPPLMPAIEDPNSRISEFSLITVGISPLVHEMPGSTSEGCVKVFSPLTSGYEKKSGIVEIPPLMPAIEDPNSRISEFSLITDPSFNGYDDDVHTTDGVKSTRDICLNPLNSGLSRCYCQFCLEPDDTNPKINMSLNYDHQNGEKRFMEASFSTSNDGDSTYDSDSDVPCFSNIETMILDMDLGGASDEESCFGREVSRFESKDSKKTIVRLEQGANSSIQRAIVFHGAMAVFYGAK